MRRYRLLAREALKPKARSQQSTKRFLDSLKPRTPNPPCTLNPIYLSIYLSIFVYNFCGYTHTYIYIYIYINNPKPETLNPKPYMQAKTAQLRLAPSWQTPSALKAKASPEAGVTVGSPKGLF